jgi:hypothetical protein
LRNRLTTHKHIDIDVFHSAKRPLKTERLFFSEKKNGSVEKYETQQKRTVHKRKPKADPISLLRGKRE